MTNLPSQMRVVRVETPGGPEALELQTAPVPVPGKGEILIRVRAAGINRPDVLQRQGGYPPPPGAPDVLGLEVAGEVVARGEAAERFAPGAPVMALVPGGGYADYALAHEDNTLPVPDGLSLTQAGGIPETFFTVWTNVFERGRLQAGETLLVHGGSSGIGTTAIQLAAAFGATVIATAGTAEKCAACEALGASLAINYRETDYVAAVKAATDGRGADLILDMVGGDYVQRNIEAAALEGRIVQIAFLQGSRVSLDLLPLMLKRMTFTGSTLRPRTVAQKATIARALAEHVVPLLAAGRCLPRIDSVFRLEQVREAHARMDEGSHIGKIVLVTG